MSRYSQPKPIRVFYSELSGRFYATRAYKSEIARIRNQHDAEIARLRAALEPFATEASVYDTIPGIIVTHDNFELWQRSNHRTKLSVGDLRYARAALHAFSERTRTEP